MHSAKPGGRGLIPNLLYTMRPWQWIKNGVVAIPFIFNVNQRWTPDDLALVSDLLMRTLWAVGLFCILSAAIYTINDIADRKRDGFHPLKRLRPIASGQLGIVPASVACVILSSASIAGGFLLDATFGIISISYLLANVSYSFLLKRFLLVDVVMISLGYVIRLWAGSVVSEAITSPWIYGTIAAGALFIALGKRYSELTNAEENASNQRGVLAHYTPQFLSQLVTITATFTLIAYALYTFTAPNLPPNKSMMLTIPFVGFGMFRYLYVLNTSSRGESPELIFLKDLPLLISILMWCITVILVLLFGLKGT